MIELYTDRAGISLMKEIGTATSVRFSSVRTELFNHKVSIEVKPPRRKEDVLKDFNNRFISMVKPEILQDDTFVGVESFLKNFVNDYNCSLE